MNSQGHPDRNFGRVNQQNLNRPLVQNRNPLLETDRRMQIEEQEFDKSNPTTAIQKETLDNSVKQRLTTKQGEKLIRIKSWLDQKNAHQNDLNNLISNLKKLEAIIDPAQQNQMDFDQLKQFVQILKDQYDELTIKKNFKRLEEIKDQLKSQDLGNFLKIMDSIEETFQHLEQLKYLEQDFGVTSQLINLLINHQSLYQENIIIEMMNEEKPVTPKQERKSIDNEQIEEVELKVFIEHLNEYYQYKSYPDDQRTGILLQLNNQELTTTDLEKYKNMDRVIIIQQFQIEQQSTNPEEKWKKTYALLDVTKNQAYQRSANLFCMPKLKPLMFSLCEKFECSTTTKVQIMPQLSIADIIKKFFQLTLKPDSKQDGIIRKIKDYMLMIKRQNNRVDCFELEQIGFQKG